MQRLIAKYGLAAHLALLAVAPFFLFPFCGDCTVAAVLLWLSLIGALWMVLEPSMRTGEGLSDARRRVSRGLLLDPLTWILLVLIVFSGVRALNAGTALCYDAESAAWYVSAQRFPLLPGAVGDAGFLPFGVTVAFSVLLLSCRHSLGRAARHLFLLTTSAGAGLSATIVLVALRTDWLAGLDSLLPSSDGIQCSFAGFAFGLYLAGGLVALVAIFERNWGGALVPAILAVGGTAAGAIAFSPPYLLAAFVVAGLLTLVYAFAFAKKSLQPVEVFRMVLVGVTALVLGGLLVAVALPRGALAERLAAFSDLKLLSEGFWKIREALSVLAFKSWISHLWLGTGVSSFPLDFRIHAQAADWVLFPRGAADVANCWWLLLAERGVVGTMLFALPFGFLLFTYVHRLIGGIPNLGFPHPACILAPMVLGLFVAAGFFGCSPLRAEVILATGSLAAISAASVPRARRRGNG